MIRLLARYLPAPLPLSRQQVVSLSQSSGVSPVELTDGKAMRGGTNPRESLPSIHHSILSGQGRSQSQEKSRVCKGQGLFLYRLNSGDHIIFRHLYIKLKFLHCVQGSLCDDAEPPNLGYLRNDFQGQKGKQFSRKQKY
jgi:hypothetical protein